MMRSALIRSSCSSIVAAASAKPLTATTQRRLGHTVRIIAKEDLPHGKAYKGDVLHVKAGHARNHLIPQKMALYATPQNFERLGITDPDVETEEEREQRLAREASMSQKDEHLLKDADRLKSYLRNKVLTIWRMVDPDSRDALHPGKVNSWQLRKKLGKQLKIDLDENESLHLHQTPVNFAELNDRSVNDILEGLDASKPCDVEIKRLGDYVAKISLQGGYSVPLKFSIVRKN
uniref:Ribosomal protein L9 domain-containing protein n=1 Tax=Craspedostauros australis TaxID=1486917 RepID=A0A6T6I5P1_9STRA|mmetsp:Transcript_9005/g.24354  ORF Transcript_9005/g.24354 Transcript_9005/m.24354 type:complete len:233 (+) Transcript_9005:48-746(+)